MKGAGVGDLIEQELTVWRAEGLLPAVAKFARYVGSTIGPEDYLQRPIIKRVQSLSRDHNSFIDVGANIGMITLPVAHLFEQCIAIEPLRETFSKLEQSIKLQGLTNTNALNCALGNERSVRSMYASKSSADTASLAEYDDLRAHSQVNVDTLDSIVETYSVKPPILIKVDVQGWELHVFEGAAATLEKECTVISEFWPWGLKSAGCKPQDYLEFMESRGYVPCSLAGRPFAKKKLDRLCRLGSNNRYVTTDLLYLKPMRDSGQV